MQNLIGKKFGRLTVISLAEKVKGKRSKWVCKCSCEQKTIKEVASGNLIAGNVRSCGCLAKEKQLEVHTKHGLWKHPLYAAVWGGIKKRCLNPKNKDYARYGGRGITICEEWKNDFKTFYDWCIENGWKKGLQIDRINVDGNYEPGNCRIVDSITQARNKRNTIKVFYNNEEICLCDAIKKYVPHLHPSTAYKRILKGWTIEDILSPEIHPQKKNRS